MKETVNKRNIWELVVASLPGGRSDLSNQLFYMIIEDVFTIKGRGEVIAGRILSGTVHIEADLIVRGNSYTVIGIELFRRFIDQAEYDDNCGILLRDDIGSGCWLKVEASVSKAFEMNGNLHINWDKLLASIKDTYGIIILKKELSKNTGSIGSLIDSIEQIISNRSHSSQSIPSRESATPGNINTDKAVKCPRCGSKNVSKTGLGIAERTIAYAASFVAGAIVSSVVKRNNADGMVREAISVEFKCKGCNNVFHSKIEE